MTSSTSDLMYALRDVPGKGKGLIATRNIPMGTRILSEEPIIRLPEAKLGIQALLDSIRRQVGALSPNQRLAFLSMHNIHANDPSFQYFGIFQTNALPFEDDVNESGIFLNACRINHACDNNAQKGWNKTIKRHTIHAKRDIEKDEEITIYYLGILNNRQTRQDALRKKFDFTCYCGLCSLPPNKSDQSDKRLDEILRLDRLIGASGSMGILSSPLKMLRFVDRQVQLYDEHGPDDNGLPRAFLDAAQINIANGDLARGRIFCERAVRGWIVLEGDDSPNVLNYKALSQDPSKHQMYGLSKRWKIALDEIPQDLNPNEFEDWLWRREKPQQPRQPADFRNRTIFPGFANLPDENKGELQRHWLFLGEIVNFATLPRLQMELKDVDKTTIPLFFYTDGRGSEVAPSKLQKGYTVAILYARRHVFASSEPGIRHEEQRNIKIFPLSLAKLLALSDRVREFSIEVKGIRTCHGCEKKLNSLKKCAKCSLFWYCDGTCQRAGWDEKGHKEDCKVLKDADLRGLFSVDWNHFENSAEFPLRIATV